MKKTIRLLDLANELGLSRNTVAKVLNGHPMPEKTRKLVLEKAIQMGYKSLGVVSQDSGLLRNQRILLINSHPLTHLNYFISIIAGIEDTIRNYNFELIQYTFNENTTYRELSNYIKQLALDGIICIESFEETFIHQLLALKIPTVFIDFLHASTTISGVYDVVMMENTKSVYTLCHKLITDSLLTKFGYVGDYHHCRGFYERFLGMIEALRENNIFYDKDLSIIKPDNFPYGNIEEMEKMLLTMKELPQVFVCANDSIAISVMKTLQKLKYKVPQDIAVIGFDDTIESQLSLPALTTVNVDKEFLGRQAIKTLINRIKHKKENNKIIYIQTKIILRNSTPRITLN